MKWFWELLGDSFREVFQDIWGWVISLVFFILAVILLVVVCAKLFLPAFLLVPITYLAWNTVMVRMFGLPDLKLWEAAFLVLINLVFLNGHIKAPYITKKKKQAVEEG